VLSYASAIRCRARINSPTMIVTQLELAAFLPTSVWSTWNRSAAALYLRSSAEPRSLQNYRSFRCHCGSAHRCVATDNSSNKRRKASAERHTDQHEKHF
jgi:hypothetical protein